MSRSSLAARFARVAVASNAIFATRRGASAALLHIGGGLGAAAQLQRAALSSPHCRLGVRSLASFASFAPPAVRESNALIEKCGDDPVQLGELFQRMYTEMRARPKLAVIHPVFLRLCSVLAAREPREYPTPLQYELMMKSFAKNTDTVGAKRLYEQFRLTGLQPTSLFYAALVHTTAKAGNMIEGLRLVDEMRAVDGMDFAAGYGSLISGLFRAEFSPAGIESVFDRMRASGCTIETRVLATMVMIAGRTGDVARALEYLETAKSAWRAECVTAENSMREPNATLQPNAYIYTNVLALAVRSFAVSLPAAAAAAAATAAAGGEPSLSLTPTKQVSPADLQKIEGVWKDMLATIGLDANPVAANVMMSFYSSVGLHDKALQVYRLIKGQQQQPAFDFPTMATVVRVLLRTSMDGNANQQLQQLHLDEAIAELESWAAAHADELRREPHRADELRQKVDALPLNVLVNAAFGTHAPRASAADSASASATATATATATAADADSAAAAALVARMQLGARSIFTALRVITIADKHDLHVPARLIAAVYERLGALITTIKQAPAQYPAEFKTEVQKAAIKVNELTQKHKTRITAAGAKTSGNSPRRSSSSSSRFSSSSSSSPSSFSSSSLSSSDGGNTGQRNMAMGQRRPAVPVAPTDY